MNIKTIHYVQRFLDLGIQAPDSQAENLFIWESRVFVYDNVYPVPRLLFILRYFPAGAVSKILACVPVLGSQRVRSVNIHVTCLLVKYIN